MQPKPYRQAWKVALFGLTLHSTNAYAEELDRAPYLQSTTHETTYIVWTTDKEAPSEVRYGSSPSDLKQIVKNDKVVTQHEIKLAGLTPNTKYYYSVGSPGNTLAGGDYDHFFQTNPAPGTRQKFRAWILGDSGDGSLRQLAVRDTMLSFVRFDRPQLFLHMGDIAYNSGLPSEFSSNFFGTYAKILQNTPVWPTMGNHEGVSSDSGTQTGPYYDAYVLPKAGNAGGIASGTEAYYSFDYANVHFIVLDSQDSPRTIDGAMLTWLKADVISTNQEWLIAYWHHPPYSKGSHDSDFEAQLIDMRQNALPILEAAGVDLVLAGHSHIYERSFLIDGAYETPTKATGHIVDSGDGKPLGNGPYVKPDGISAHEGAVYVVAGNGGALTAGLGGHPVMYYDEVDNGSCLLDIQENRLSLLNLRKDGVITDRFSLLKGKGIVVAAPDGGETLEQGTTYDIRWATVGNVSDVKIEYSRDNGQTYTTIIASTPNTGTFAWSVPAVDSKRALVRISNAADATLFDESNAGFTMLGGTPFDAVAFGDEWKYNDEGIDMGNVWVDQDFDDAIWKSGKGQLGYGENDESTTLIKVLPNYPSVYFRKKIKLDKNVNKARLTVLHDDGIIVWINGRQVYSKYAADPWYGAFATAQSADNEIDSLLLPLEPSPFVVGENIIAVTVKQVSDTSSDLSFDLSLTVTPALSNEGAGGAGSGTGGVGGDGPGGPHAGGNGLPGETPTCGVGTIGMTEGLGSWTLGLLFAIFLRRSKKTAL